MRKELGLTMLCLALAFLCSARALSIASASPSRGIFDLPTWTPPLVGPPTSLDGEPVGIPDAPFVERYGDKYMYLLMLTSACGSSPGSCNWNAAVDLNCDNVVDICDAIIFANNC